MAVRATAPVRRLSVTTLLLCGAVAVSGCQKGGPVEEMEDIASSTVKFDSATYGVPASPRVVDAKAKSIKKGGGREQVGKPYKIRGKWYYPKDEPGYVATGSASWYGPNFHGRLTANGETYDMHGLSAAHKTFPLPSYAMVTNLKNGHRVMVRINDRGPFAHGREIDLSAKAADMLGFKSAGITDVKVEYVGRAPLEGDDTPKLMASFQPGTSGEATSMVASIRDDASSRLALNNETAPVPGVRPMMSLFQSRPTGAGSAVNSFTAEPVSGGASAALDRLGAAGRAEAARINLGTIDRSLMTKVGDVVGVNARARAEATDRPGYVTATVTADPKIDPDRLLRRLWAAGFEEAFTVRD